MAEINLYRARPRLIREFVIDALVAGLVPFIQSSPGMGKSAIIKSIAKELNLKLIDHRLSTSPPEDLSGLPRFNDKGQAVFAPFAELFPIQGTKIPDGYNGWLLFLDEFNSAKKDTQAAAYKLILDRCVGQAPLHEHCIVACAGNLSTDRAIVNPLSTAMQSRVIHLEMEISQEDWLYDVAFAEDYDPRIIAYLSQYPDRLMDFRPDHKDRTFCCPRTWEFMNRLIKNQSVTDQKVPLYAGTITSGVAADFVQFSKVYKDMPKVSEIMANPAGYPVPTDISTRWAIVTALLQHTTVDNLDKINLYIKKFDLSFRVLFFRGVMAKVPDARHCKAFTEAMIELQRYLRGD